MDQSTAPGFMRRSNRETGPACYWVASRAVKSPGEYPLKTVRIHGTDEEMAHRCRILTAEIREWLAAKGLGAAPVRDGTVGGLVKVYRKTAESPYREVKHSTRVMYDESLGLLTATVGQRRLDALTGLDFARWYNNLKAPAVEGGPERVRRAYKAIQLLRIIVKFGVVANVPECQRLNQALAAMRFTSPPKRTEALTYAQMMAICAGAIATGLPRVAIAQALQFELTLRQIDVIGEWQPRDVAGGGILYHGQQWSGGVQWSHISAEWILQKKTTKTGQMAMHDIREYPFLFGLLQMIPLDQRIGPIVLDADGLPFHRQHYAKIWRKLANKVGVPADVLNRDSRAGGVTEGSDAGADIEHLRHHANHSDIRTTGRYNRKTLEKTRSVAKLRIAHRSEA